MTIIVSAPNRSINLTSASVLHGIVSRMNAFLNDATINKELPWHFSFCHVFSLLGPDQYQSKNIYFTNLCSQSCICSQSLTVGSGIHMEHIVVVMSSGGCPAAYRARNLQDHMVRNHSVVSLHSWNLSSLLHTHTQEAHKTYLEHKQVDTHKDTQQAHTQIT